MGVAEWVTALVLLVIAVAGLYAGIMALVRRKWVYPPYVVEGRGAIALGLLYLAGAAAAALGLVLIFATQASG